MINLEGFNLILCCSNLGQPWPHSSDKTYHWMRFACYQGNRTLLLVFMVGISLGSPLIQVSFRSMEATVYDASFLLKRLTNSISLMPVAKAWLPCQETCIIFKGFFFIYIKVNVAWQCSKQFFSSPLEIILWWPGTWFHHNLNHHTLREDLLFSMEEAKSNKAIGKIGLGREG